MYLLRKSRPLQGRMEFNGLQISIETGRSRLRTWHNPHDGTSGHNRMALPYGYIRGTMGRDKDALDCFVGPDRAAPEVYVVHIMKAPDFTEEDECKCFLGLSSPEEAKRIFDASYSDPRFYGGMSIWPFAEFKEAVYQMKGKKMESRDQYLHIEPPLGGLKKSGEALCKQVGDSLGVDWKKYDLDEFCDGMFEEGDKTSNAEEAARLVLANLDKDRHYYSNLQTTKQTALLKARAGIWY